MATLADELMEDFMSDGDGEFESGGEEAENGENGHIEQEERNAKDEEDFEEAEEEEDDEAKIKKMDLTGVSDVRSVASLMKSLKPVIEQIDFYLNLPPEKQTRNIGSIEDNPEYKLLTEANSLASGIDSEVILVSKFIQDHYTTFPGLHTLVSNPLQYSKVVAIIGNGPVADLKNKVNSTDNIFGQSLKEILDGAALLSLTLSAATTTSKPMPEHELQAVMKACELVVELDRAKQKIRAYVTSRMNQFAPNLTTLIGSETAAQLVNTAGGLAQLARIPSCNIANIGMGTGRREGFSNIGVRQKGHLYHSPLVQNVPMHNRVQAMRIIAAKLVLAARVDQTLRTPGDNTMGQKFREDCAHRLEKLTEAAPNKGPRALPAPDDKPSRKRGGKRARKAKEQYALTDLQKQQNRMAFGKEEIEVGYGVGDDTKGLGMIGQQNDGRIRGTTIDKRTQARLSKKNPGWGGPSGSGLASSLKGFGQGSGTVTGLRTSGVGTSLGGGGAGTASVIAFDANQGLSLVDPKKRDEMLQKRKADDDRYFKNGTFTNVGGGSSSVVPQAKVDDAGFKVPALPALKRVKKSG